MMINRIVKITFREEFVNDFTTVFNTNKHLIRGFIGCNGVELLRDVSNPAIFFTYSKWEDEASLEAYRNSTLFNEVWSTVKKWFSDRPEAWSVEVVN